MHTSAYINTDLEIKSSENLEALAQVLAKECTVLHTGCYEGIWIITCESDVEAFDEDKNRNPETHSADLLNILEGLREDHQQQLRKSSTVTFDIGFDPQTNDQFIPQYTLSPKLLKRIADFGASVTITVYSD